MGDEVCEYCGNSHEETICVEHYEQEMEWKNKEINELRSEAERLKEMMSVQMYHKMSKEYSKKIQELESEKQALEQTLKNIKDYAMDLGDVDVGEMILHKIKEFGEAE